jgi:hypothetical protein
MQLHRPARLLAIRRDTIDELWSESCPFAADEARYLREIDATN